METQVQDYNFQKDFMSPDQKFLLRLDEIIEEEFKEHKDTYYYATRLGVSTKVLNNILDYNRSMTLHELLQRRIFREAISLIQQTRMSIKEISYELGIEPAYFCRRCKQLTGQTPGMIRRRKKK